MKERAYAVVDVFTTSLTKGNPVAVVLEGDGLSDSQMQAFASWTNLSETTFVLTPTHPEADYRLRIFTPGGELPFAGHPTLGSCSAWLAAGHRPKAALIKQECGVGLVSLQQAEHSLAFAAPALRQRPIPEAELALIINALGISPAAIIAAQVLDNGPVWHSLLLNDVATVLALTPDYNSLKAANINLGLAALTPKGADSDLEVRAFVPAIGVPEDPVTGSLNASLAQWLIATGHLPKRYVASQGQALGRAGRVALRQDEGGRVWVGGACVVGVKGVVMI